MNDFLNSRLVKITDQSSIDSLKRGDVISVLKMPLKSPTYRVFLETIKTNNGTMSTFYTSISLRPGAVVKWSTRRDWLHPMPDGSGIMLANECAYDRREILTIGDKGYEELRADLSNLDLMR